MIATGQLADVLAAHWARDVTAQEHCRDLRHLIDVVALLPTAHLSPRDLRRRVEGIERFCRHAAAAHLVRRNPEVAELELLVLAHENVEWCEIAMQRLALVQCVERLENRGNLAPDESLGLWALLREPCAEVTVFGVFHGEAISH